MKNLMMAAGLAGGLIAMIGCDALTGIFLPTTVTVTLRNTTGFNVDVQLFYDDEQDLPEFLLTEIGEEIEETVLPGVPFSFTRNCDELQAIVIDDADLRLPGGFGPEANTDVLRDGDEFRCGDQIVFTFSYDESLLDFDIDWVKSSGTILPF
jgi:hypothetical protein